VIIDVNKKKKKEKRNKDKMTLGNTDYFKFFIKEELKSNNKKLESPQDYEAMINCMRNVKLAKTVQELQDGPVKSGFDKSKAVSWCSNDPLVMEYPKEPFESIPPSIIERQHSSSLSPSPSTNLDERKVQSNPISPSLSSSNVSSPSAASIETIETTTEENTIQNIGGSYFTPIVTPITHMIRVYSGNFTEDVCYKTIVVAESQSLKDICRISSVKYLIDHDFYEYQLDVVHHKTFVPLKAISQSSLLSNVIAIAKKQSRIKSKKSFPQTDYKLVLNRRLSDIPVVPFYINVSVSTPNTIASRLSSFPSVSSSSSSYLSLKRQQQKQLPSRRLLVKSNWTGYEVSRLIIDNFELIPPYGFEIQPKLILSPSNTIIDLNQTIAKAIQDKSDAINQCGLHFVLEPRLVIK